MDNNDILLKCGIHPIIFKNQVHFIKNHNYNYINTTNNNHIFVLKTLNVKGLGSLFFLYKHYNY